jgi:hypothetical protein
MKPFKRFRFAISRLTLDEALSLDLKDWHDAITKDKTTKNNDFIVSFSYDFSFLCSFSFMSTKIEVNNLL